ncbi:MAG: hypothetical protein KIH69_013405 [Anaerolineae bacterium]|nr:hypothetical protein [Anaerolineae bacterium]
MYAVEFETQITNGKIEIPNEYQLQLIDSVRVIILMRDRKRSSNNFIEQLIASPKAIEDFKPLTRDLIYDE